MFRRRSTGVLKFPRCTDNVTFPLPALCRFHLGIRASRRTTPHRQANVSKIIFKREPIYLAKVSVDLTDGV